MGQAVGGSVSCGRTSDPCPAQEVLVHPPPLSSLRSPVRPSCHGNGQPEGGGGNWSGAPPPLPSPIASDPFPLTLTQAQRVGSGRKRWRVREGERQEGCEGQTEGGEGQRKIRGRWEGGIGGLQGGQGSLALRGEGVRSSSSSLLPPTRFSRQKQQVAGEEGPLGEGEEAAGGREEGTAEDRAGVGLPLAAPSTALETALPTWLARLPRPASSSSASLPSSSPSPTPGLPPSPLS